MKKIILLLLSIFLSGNLQAQIQQEYVVTNESDTIFGKVIRGTRYDSPSVVIFKIIDNEGKKHDVNPDEVQLIRSFQGSDGDSEIITIEKKYFAKKVLSGRITMYRTVETEHYYVSKNNKDLELIFFGGATSPKIAHSEIRALIKDNRAVAKEFDKLSGTEKNIFYILKKYNSLYKD